MLGKRYDGEACSAARALEVVGERWSLLIVRDALFAGSARFTAFQRKLGIAPNILTARLRDLVTNGIFAEPGTGGQPEYELTDKGRALAPVIVALTAWGDQWMPPDAGPPVTYRHRECGGAIEQHIRCTKCGVDVASNTLEADVATWAREFKRIAAAARTTH